MQRWVAEEEILPLLDGLDEVAQEQRQACVEAIRGDAKQMWIQSAAAQSPQLARTFTLLAI